MFIYDTSFDTDETYSLRISETYNQTYFSATLDRAGQALNANFYLNHMPELPSGILLYDYFGSGEMFYSSSGIDSSIVSVSKKVLQNIYTMVTETASKAEEYSSSVIFKNLDYSEILNTISSLKIHSCWVKPAYGFENHLLLVSMQDLFNNESSPEKISHPALCSHVTLVSSERNYVSENYEFANIINSYPSCSHPNLSGKHVPCYFVNNLTTCPLYEQKSETVTKVSINHTNTDNSTVFSVRKLHLTNMEYSYSIFNNSENQNVFNINVPSDVPQEEVDSHLSSLLEELLYSYKGDTVEHLSLDDKCKDSHPFIASVLN